MSNNASDTTIACCQWPINKKIRMLILMMIMLVTLIGNSYIIIELLFRRRHRTRLQLFILNLAIGDLTICLCTMTSELFLLIFDQQWILGNVACKLTLYIQVVTLASTTFINVAMTYDRYEAVCCPLQSRITFRRVRRIIIICWLSSLVAAIPQLFIFKQSLIPDSTTKYQCASTGYTAEWQRRLYFTAFACYVLVVPAFCMTIWYIKIINVVALSAHTWVQKTEDQPGTTTAMISPSSTSLAKVKTVQLAMTIIVVFVVCWTPYMVLTLIQIYSNGYWRIPSWLDEVIKSICLTQSSLNPFIYIIFNNKRKHSSTIVLALARTSLQLSRTNRSHRM